MLSMKNLQQTWTTLNESFKIIVKTRLQGQSLVLKKTNYELKCINKVHFIARARGTVNFTLVALEVTVQITHAKTEMGSVTGNPARQS